MALWTRELPVGVLSDLVASVLWGREQCGTSGEGQECLLWCSMSEVPLNHFSSVCATPLQVWKEGCVPGLGDQSFSSLEDLEGCGQGENRERC